MNNDDKIDKNENEKILNQKELGVIRAIAEFNAFRWFPVDRFGWPNSNIGPLILTLGEKDLRIVCMAFPREDGGLAVELPLEVKGKADNLEVLAWMVAPAAYNRIKINEKELDHVYQRKD